jgi:hydroxymethylglutaryl-CoA synthase
MTTPHTHSPTLLKPAKPVGIIGYGAYVPRYRLPATEVARVWTGGKGGLPIKEKAVPGLATQSLLARAKRAFSDIYSSLTDPLQSATTGTS